jgi:dTDP-4-amino-4,6-dideoxygalactose transaminase
VLALRALGVGPGDEVVVPTNTFVATAEAVVLCGATPRFADVDADTLLLTADTLSAALTPATKVVIVVHLYGQTADMDAINAVAEREGVLVVEDAAQAHGALWRDRRAGSLGRVGCFSFYPGKNLGAFGDGGAVVTSDPRIDESVRLLRDHGRAIGSHYDHTAVGTNSRLDALQAAVLSAKLPRLDAWNAARRRIVARYSDVLAGSDLRLVRIDPLAVPVHHLAVVRAADRDELQATLAAEGVGTGIHYPTPCHLLEPYRRWADRPLPHAERAAREVLSLPVFPHMSEAQIRQVCSALSLVASRGISLAPR